MIKLNFEFDSKDPVSSRFFEWLSAFPLDASSVRVTTSVDYVDPLSNSSASHRIGNIILEFSPDQILEIPDTSNILSDTTETDNRIENLTSFEDIAQDTPSEDKKNEPTLNYSDTFDVPDYPEEPLQSENEGQNDPTTSDTIESNTINEESLQLETTANLEENLEAIEENQENIDSSIKASNNDESTSLSDSANVLVKAIQKTKKHKRKHKK